MHLPDDHDEHQNSCANSRRDRGRSQVRLLCLLGPEAVDVERDALAADTGFRARQATSFERVAVVSDEDWTRPALRALSFLLPGRAKGFQVDELAAAKAWLADGLVA